MDHPPAPVTIDLSFAFAGIVRGKLDVRTMGMHVLGLHDLVVNRTAADGLDIIEVICYLARGERPLGAGHVPVAAILTPPARVIRRGPFG